MVKTEFYRTREDGVKLVRSYSTNSMMIENPEGVRYSEAIDPEEMHRTYTETDERIPANDFQRLEKRLRAVEKILISNI